ncbi:MAG: radical SAM protein [Patescibacteria group bacterium]|nr:radical SAM protein [Patescibacteria group bacterium]
MKIGLCVFPKFTDNHLQNKSTHELGQRLEPSVLYLASQRPGDVNVFIDDNDPEKAKDCDLVLCSIYTRGLKEFREFSEKVGKDKIIAGGYHPTADPEGTLKSADTVVTGLTANIEEILDQRPRGIVRGKVGNRPMKRDLLSEKNLDQMRQVYPDVYPGMRTGRSTSSVGCPFDCSFCSTPKLSGRKMTSFDLEHVEADVENLKKHKVKVVFVSDESFTTRPQLKETVEVYGKGGFDVLYSFGTATTLTDEKMKFLADNNWHSLNLGLEEINTTYRKNKDLARAIELGKKYGVKINFSFIVNDYGKSLNESLRDYHALFQAFVDYKPAMVAANFMMPFPGTGIWDEYKHRVTEDDFVKFDSKTPIFSKEKLADWHKHMAVAVQLAYYHSDEYKEVRDFHCGDNLDLRFRELEKQFGMENGGWKKWFDPENKTKTLIPEGLNPDEKENEMSDLSSGKRKVMAATSLPVIRG